MFLAEHVVVHVVGGGDFETACTEVDLYVVVLDDGDLAAYEGNDHALAAEVLVLGVVGVDAHRGVAHDGLRTGSGHDGIAFLADDFVAEVVKFGMFFLVNDFDVGECGLGFGVPVDHALSAIDEALAVEVDEDFDDGAGADVVHRESCAVPVAGCAEFFELFEDDSAVFFFPFPGVAEEFVACEVAFLDSFGCELGNDLSLGGDGCVVGSGNPEGIFAHEAGAADEDVLNGVVEHVAHVEDAGHIGRGDNDCVGLAGIGFGVEQAVLHPVGIPFVFDGTRVIFRC